MTANLITPDELPQWAPGQLTVHSPEQGWHPMTVRGYRYRGLDVELPPVCDYLVVAYLRGETVMSREVDGHWTRQMVRPGDVSLLTRAALSHWVWPDGIEVVHVYLTQQEIAATCREMYDREIEEIGLHDVLKVSEPTLFRTTMQIAAEAARGGVGSKLVVDALACELSVSILRRHAEVRFCKDAPHSGLGHEQLGALNDFIRDSLEHDLTVSRLAEEVGLSRYHFTRRFKQSTGLTPHDYVTQQRVERAMNLLRRTRLPIAEIAIRCGFSDQSHFTRVFGQRVGVTPAKYRQG